MHSSSVRTITGLLFILPPDSFGLSDGISVTEKQRGFQRVEIELGLTDFKLSLSRLEFYSLGDDVGRNKGILSMLADHGRLHIIMGGNNLGVVYGLQRVIQLCFSSE